MVILTVIDNILTDRTYTAMTEVVLSGLLGLKRRSCTIDDNGTRHVLSYYEHYNMEYFPLRKIPEETFCSRKSSLWECSRLQSNLKISCTKEFVWLIRSIYSIGHLQCPSSTVDQHFLRILLDTLHVEFQTPNVLFVSLGYVVL